MRPHPASHVAATAALFVTLGAGCAITRSGDARYPGVVEKNPNAAIRAYPASATRVAWALTEVMKKDPILDDVKLMADPQTRDWRGFTHAERQALGFSGVKALQRDVNYNITAKSKDGQKVGVLVLLKGESGSEVSMLYGAAGDADLSRVLLDQVDAAMVGPLKDPGAAPAVATTTAPKRPENR
jgi:hypothetical protein